LKSLLIAIFSTILFTQTQIGLTNIQYIEFKDGGRILRPTFSPSGEYLVVEQFGGSKSNSIDQKIIFIDLKNLKKFQVKKSSASKNPLKCSDLKWSISEPSYAYLTAKLSGRERFYKIHYKNMISGNPNYMIEWTDNIFGTGKRGNQLHSFSITEYGNKDIILFCFVDQAKGFVTQNQFGFYTDGDRNIIYPNLENAFTQMEINSLDDGYLSLMQTDKNNNNMIILMEDPLDDADSQIKLSPYNNNLIVYEKKLNVNTSDDLYLSFLAKKVEKKKEKITELYIVEDPFDNDAIRKIVSSIHIVDEGNEKLNNFNHQWHPETNIIFYIKRIIEEKQDSHVLYAYDVENNEEIEINTGLDDLQHLAISADGQKIALCGIVPGRLWVGDLRIN